MVKNSSANAGDARDVGLIPGWGRSPGGGNGNPLQFSCLENPMGRGAWWAIIQGLNLGSLHWEHEVSATGLSGKSNVVVVLSRV